MARPLRIGIIGAGAFASRRHLPELVSSPDVTVVAACRRDRDALDTVADHFAIPRRFAEWREMLDRVEMDAVVIATPHDQHSTQAAAALERGLHILLEKPMALTVEEARSLRDLARSKGLVLSVGFNPPYWGHTRALKQGISAGKIGTLESASIVWLRNVEHVFGKAPLPEDPGAIVKPTLFRGDAQQNGGGQLMDGGGHLLSELLYVTCKRALSVSALMDQTPQDMRAVVTVRLEDDVFASVSAVANSGSGERRVRSAYDGSLGTVQAAGSPPTVVWPTDDTSALLDTPAPTPVGDWLTCIRTGAVPAGSADHALEVTELLAAAYRSAETGCTVTLQGAL